MGATSSTPGTFEQWRNAVRPLLAAGVEPASLEWNTTFTWDTAPAVRTQISPPRGPPPRISPALLRLLQAVAIFRQAGRWEFMYRLAWRCMIENPRLLDDAADPDVRRATLMERAIRRDVHKMHAFVRFREVLDTGGAQSYFAWFEPQHEILRRGARFFVERFPNMVWTIATPDGAAVWDLHTLAFVDSPDMEHRPRTDDYENLWRTYYRSICNVARINPTAMQREMPQRYWKHLPEAAEIQALLREGVANFTQRTRESVGDGIAMAKALKRALPAAGTDEGPASCRRCDLWRHATQAVAGAGAAHARIMLVGEQPGDEEDLRGHPFVGPAGRLLDQIVLAAGLQRDQLFITNAVKHFKWEPRGKRRLHKKPGTGEIDACQVWLEREIGAVGPVVIVALGASALRALTGATMSIEAARHQELVHPSGAQILATYHPAAILRADDDKARALRTHLENDLRRAADLVAQKQ